MASETLAQAGASDVRYGGWVFEARVQTMLLAVAILSLTVPVWWGAIAKARGYELVVFGTLQTVIAVAGFIVGTWLTVTVQRLNRRIVLVISGLTMSSCDLLTIAAVEPYALYAVRAVHASAAGVVAILGMVYLGYTRDPAKSYGWYTTFQALIQSIGLFFVPVIAKSMGFNGLQIAMAVPGLIVAALALQLPASAPVVAAPADGSVRPAIPKLPWGPAIPALLAFLAFGFYTTDFFAYSERFGNARGLDPERIGLILAVTTAAGIPASLFVSWLGERLGTLIPVCIGAAFGAAAAVLLLLPQFGEGGYWVALVVFSLVWSFVLPYLFALFAKIDPVGRLLIATQPVRAAINVVLAAGLTAAIAKAGLPVVAWLAIVAVILCPVFVATALAMHRRKAAREQAGAALTATAGPA